MAVLGQIPGRGPLVDLEVSHLEAWSLIASDEDTKRWEHLWRNPTGDPEALRKDRRDRYDGATWEETVSTGWETENGGGMYRDVVLTDGVGGEVLAVMVLQGAQCPQWWEPAVSVAYAVHPTKRRTGIGTDLLVTLPTLIAATTTVEHVIGEVCTRNADSRKVMENAGWELAVSGVCEMTHPRSPSCARVTETFCSKPANQHKFED
jgi:RimJ/RimL family protein N-acetyltransferase